MVKDMSNDTRLKNTEQLIGTLSLECAANLIYELTHRLVHFRYSFVDGIIKIFSFLRIKFFIN